MNIARLRALLSYDSETGELTWRRRAPSEFRHAHSADAWNARYSGRPAGSNGSYGERNLFLGGKYLKAHRIAWAIHHGKWPCGEIDHINGNASDNRIVNLRDVSHIENQRNQKMHTNNTSGICGVRWRSDIKRWEAIIGVRGRNRYLGAFRELPKAVAARQAAETELGYSSRHGS